MYRAKSTPHPAFGHLLPALRGEGKTRVRRWVAGLCPDCGSHHGSCAAGFAAPAAPTTSRAAPRFCRSDGSREAGELTATVSIAIVRRYGSDLCPDCGHHHGSCAAGFAAPAAPTTSRTAPRFCRSDASREAGELAAIVLIAIPRRCGTCLCPDCVILGRSCAMGFAAPAAPTTSRAAPRFCGSDASREAGKLTATVSIAIVRRCGACLCPDCVRLGRSCAAGFATSVAPTTAKTTSAAAEPRFCRSDASREAGELAATVSIAIVRRWVAGLCPDCGRRRGSYAAGFATCVAPTTAKTTSATPRFCGSDGSREAGELAAAVSIAIVRRCGAGLCPDCGRRRGSYAAGFATCVAPTTAKTTSAAPRFCGSDGSREADELTAAVSIAIVRRCGACLCPDCGRRRGSYAAGFATCVAPTTAKTTSRAAPHGITLGQTMGNPVLDRAGVDGISLTSTFRRRGLDGTGQIPQAGCQPFGWPLDSPVKIAPGRDHREQHNSVRRQVRWRGSCPHSHRDRPLRRRLSRDAVPYRSAVAARATRPVVDARTDSARRRRQYC